ncbi:hypothetical protein J2X31_003201 [Flavobacterium arsenatis]|uniref:Uncharacterized protein n=1 Tax=Flavobacterium arsenatis TaxID=1484332 RepID=A0ABU1TTG6_9FLAO|nr:hypothetical protein [Flavobacterium arsenatis]MDR6969174.1 hypothetical protein [Flavobacterium arsenatis]
MDIIIKKDWNYSLYSNNNMLIFSVLCGTVAQFEVDIELNQEEKDKYDSQGEVF